MGYFVQKNKNNYPLIITVIGMFVGVIIYIIKNLKKD